MPAAGIRTKRSLKEAWLASDAELLPFCSANPFQPDWLALAEGRGQVPVNRTLLVDTLLAQYAGFPATAAVVSNIEALRAANTFCITTGQQPGFLGGPLYTLYKAITAIKLARQLSAQHPDYRFVPLFWVASEDHDVDEVNHAYLGYGDMRTYHDLTGGAVGRDVLTEAAAPLVAHSSLLQEAYTAGRTWGEAFRRILHGLLGSEGLIVLEPDDAALKAAFSPILVRELHEPGSEAAVLAANEGLAALGYKTQIHPRAVNLFLLRAGARLRLERSETGVISVVEGTPDDAAALQMALQQKNWAQFSPNVVLRPVYQETVVPSVAYIGGWAEVSYWLQLKGVFQRYGTHLPVVLPRAQALLVRESEMHQLKALDLTLEALLQPDARLKEQLGQRQWDGQLLAPARGQVAAALQSLEDAVSAIDTGQLRNLKGAQVQTARFFDRLEQKLRRALLQQHPEWSAAAFALKATIQPQGAVQERVLNWSAFGAEDPGKLVAYLLAHLDPTARGVQTLVLPGV